jgi:S-adenosylmethionine synthetase
MRLIVSAKDGLGPQDDAVEIVERKGLGHPDTICDAIAEEICIRLCREYLRRFGVILHHNVDKLLLVAGAARPAFGGGEITAPLELHLAGRAVDRVGRDEVPVADIAVAAARDWLGAHIPGIDLDRHVRIIPHLRPGSTDLAALFARSVSTTAVALANDTSCGAGFAPTTRLERAVLEVERALNRAETKRRHPEIGTDVKVMGLRLGARLQLTVGCAFVSRHVADLADYQAKKLAVEALALEAARRASGIDDVSVAVNTGDDLAAGSAYLTVTGTSAEAGDDGEVGRGNRVGGLITPGRPMTLEAAAGKNPVTHVGKLYGVLAPRIAAGVTAALGEPAAAECLMLSQIGRPVAEPALVDVRVSGARRPTSDLEAITAEVVRAELGRLDEVRSQLLAAAPGLSLF